MPVTYNVVLVAISAFIAVAAAYLALELSSRLFTLQGASRRVWLLGGAVSMGTGIWSMHFVAMLAWSIPIYVRYNLLIVLISLILAILAAFQAFIIVNRPKPSTQALLGGSAVMGVGIALMHYSGMTAIEMPAMLSYKPELFALSVAIAVIVSLVALKLFIAFRDSGRTSQVKWKLITALVMGASVMSMHYTGMAAAVITPQPGKQIALSNIDNTWLSFVVCIFTFCILGAMAAVLFDEPQKSGSRASGQ